MRLVEILRNVEEAEIINQTAAILGSLALGPVEKQADIFNSESKEVLLRCLQHQDSKVIETACRSLKILFRSCSSADFLSLSRENVKLLVSLLSHENDYVTEKDPTMLQKPPPIARPLPFRD